VVRKRVSGPLYIKGRAGEFWGRGFDRASVTASQQAFQVASTMEDAENKYLLLLLLEFIEEQMFLGIRQAKCVVHHEALPA
jgi:hypothetical protein